MFADSKDYRPPLVATAMRCGSGPHRDFTTDDGAGQSPAVAWRRAPADENHPTEPIDIYGGTKLSGEVLTRAFSRRFGLEYTIIRPSAVYGPTDANRRVTQIFVENALEGKPLVLHNGGLDQLDFTHVEDTAQGFVLAAFAPEARNETFNITRGEGRSNKEFAEILADLIPGVTTVERPPDERRPVRGALDISKARRLLGYEPKYSLEEGMRQYVAFVRQEMAPVVV